MYFMESMLSYQEEKKEKKKKKGFAVSTGIHREQ